MRKGFTLVELSIALVIVGLLIGGILVGQSLTDSAKITAAVSQIQQFDTAVLSFKTKYKYLPGDSPFHGPGDGDGRLENGSPSTLDNILDCFGREVAGFWQQLDSQEYPGYSAYSGCTPTVMPNIVGANKNVPEFKLGKKGSFVAAIASGSPYYAVSPTRNYYVVADPTQPNGTSGVPRWRPTTSANSPLKPVEMAALDSKLDDAQANSGYLRSGQFSGGGSAGPYEAALATCSSGTTYDLTQSGYECTPLIRIGAQGGNPL